MAAKAKKRPSMFQMLLGFLITAGVITFWGKTNKDDTGLLKQLSLPFFMGGILVLIMGIGFGIAYYYHRKRQAEELELLSAPKIRKLD